MDVLITPGELAGTVTAPASKSDVHRALICAALADRPTVIRSVKQEIVSVSHDIHATADALGRLGATFQRDTGSITVNPIPKKGLPLQQAALNCGSSGSTARFLLPIAAVLSRASIFYGSPQLAARPLGDLMVSMYEHGARFSPADAPTTGPLTLGGAAANLRNLKMPLKVFGGLEPGSYEIPGDISSQYVTGLLFALALLSQLTGEESSLLLTSTLESAGYVDMTIESLAKFGVFVEPQVGGWFIPGGQTFTSPGEVLVEGDWTNGAILMALASYNPGVKVKGLKGSSLQGDRVIERLLPVWRSVREDRTIDVRDTPDLFPLLALLAAAPVQAGTCAPTTTFVGIDRLRFKESNRIDSTAALLAAAGCTVEAEVAQCRITAITRTPGAARPVIEVNAADDHRIVMAATVAAHVFDTPVLIHGAESVDKSYPVFFDDYRHLGGSARVVGDGSSAAR